MNDTTIGLDIAKSIFHLVEINHRGKVVRKKTLRRPALPAFSLNYPRAKLHSKPVVVAITGDGNFGHLAMK